MKQQHLRRFIRHATFENVHGDVGETDERLGKTSSLDDFDSMGQRYFAVGNLVSWRRDELRGELVHHSLVPNEITRTVVDWTNIREFSASISAVTLLWMAILLSAVLFILLEVVGRGGVSDKACLWRAWRKLRAERSGLEGEEIPSGCQDWNGLIEFEDLNFLEVIGSGGFGQVWRAEYLGVRVAVKVLNNFGDNKHMVKPTLKQLQKDLKHPNICLYMGACVTPPNRAIVTELASIGSVWNALRLPLQQPYVACDGTHRGAWPRGLYPLNLQGTLSTVSPEGTWPWQLVKRVARGAAMGMEYLHRRRPPVLHRDLKSANLLLDDGYCVKVCDFGMSTMKAHALCVTKNCGTVQWMAPEVLAHKEYDEKADVFSYGIVLWELLSRQCPYQGMTGIQCAMAVLNQDARPEIPKWCPPTLRSLIETCTARNPARRPSFSEILASIDTFNG